MKKVIPLLLVFLLLFSIVGCKQETVRQNDPQVFEIITTCYPIYSVTAYLTEGAENVMLENFVSEDHGCMHGYVLTSEDMKRLSGADLFIASGAGMEEFVGKTHLGIPQLELLDSGEDINDILEKDGKENPHYWMDTEKAIEQCEKIKRNLCRLDPKNEAVYMKNAESFAKKLNALAKDAEKRIGALRSRQMIVYHDSFEYFANRFGLEIISVTSDGGKYSAGISPEEAAAYMKYYGITTIFADKSFANDKTLLALAKDADAEIVLLDALSVGTKADAVNAYENSMKHNLKELEYILG